MTLESFRIPSLVISLVLGVATSVFGFFLKQANDQIVSLQVKDAEKTTRIAILETNYGNLQAQIQNVTALMLRFEIKLDRVFEAERRK